jgi:hypothetical protein
LAAGFEPFHFGNSSSTQIETDFSYFGSIIKWNNAAFLNGDSIFAWNPTNNLIEVFYSGEAPATHQVVSLAIIFGDTVQAGKLFL